MRQIFVDSRDRTSGTSCDFSIMLPQTLALSGGHQGRIDDLRIPVTVPTISPGNNLIWTQMGSQAYESTIPTGQYESGAALAQAIQQALSNVPGAWTVVYDPRNVTLGFACSNGFSFIGGNWMEKLLGAASHLQWQLWLPLFLRSVAGSRRLLSLLPAILPPRFCGP